MICNLSFCIWYKGVIPAMIEVKSTTELFNTLRHQELLSNDNTNVLKEILFVLQREGWSHGPHYFLYLSYIEVFNLFNSTC